MKHHKKPFVHSRGQGFTGLCQVGSEVTLFGLEVSGFRFAGFLELFLGVGLKPFPERNMTKTVPTL